MKRRPIQDDGDRPGARQTVGLRALNGGGERVEVPSGW